MNVSSINKSIFKFLTILSVLFFAAVVIFAIPSFFDPEFEVKNNSDDVVSVVAVWRNNEKNIGEILPMSSYVFSLDDEASIRFRVIYSNKKIIESKELYFTRGIKVIAIISDNAVEVSYDFEK